MRRNIINVGLVMSLVILGATAGVVYKNTNELVHTSDWVSHKQEIIEELGSTLISLTDAETAQQGYIRTGGEQQMEMYNAAIQVIHERLNRLRTLTLDDRKQQQRLNAIEPLVTQKLAVLNDSIQLWKDKPSDAESQAFLNSQGRTLMEDIRGIIAELKIEENELLKQRREDSKTKTQEAILILFMGNILSIALLALVFYRLNREIAEHKHAQEVLSSERAGIFSEDTATLFPIHELPLAQITGGEEANGDQREDESRKFNGALEYQRIEYTAADRDIILLGEMGDLLRTCRAPEEAYNVLAHCLGKLFPAASGSLCVLTAPQNLVETAVVWGDSEPD
ncbi:MAG TPA: CHASE3 domain-containing protein, partial [Nitrospiria bacterium]|nr:CHASE3 domain-containing protein [Nitrospiria bacterium]